MAPGNRRRSASVWPAIAGGEAAASGHDLEPVCGRGGLHLKVLQQAMRGNAGGEGGDAVLAAGLAHVERGGD